MTETVSELEARYDRAIRDLEDALYRRIQARLAKSESAQPSAPAGPAPAVTAAPPARKQDAPARSVQYRTPNPGRTFRQEPSEAARIEERVRPRRILRTAFYLAAFATAVGASLAVIYVPEANELGREVMDSIGRLAKTALSHIPQ